MFSPTSSSVLDTDIRTPLQALARAVEDGKDECAAALVGAPTTASNSEQESVGANALLAAAREGDALALRGLLDAGVSVNAAEENAFTALHMAAANNHLACAALLLARGADASASDDYGQQPLSWASRSCAVAVAELLLDEGVDVNAADLEGNCALHWAARRGKADCVALLLQHGADASARNAAGQTAEQLSDTVSVLALFLPPTTATTSEQESVGANALLAAAREGDALALRGLLDAGVSVNAADENGFTALHMAAANDQLACAALLLARGAARDARNMFGRTPAERATTEQMRDLLAAAETPGEEVAAAQPVAEEEEDAELAEAIRRSLADMGGAEAAAPPAAAAAAAAAADADVDDEPPTPSRAAAAAEAESECVICLSAPKAAGLLHGSSMHAVACEDCAPLLLGKPCPICRAQVEKVLPLRNIFT